VRLCPWRDPTGDGALADNQPCALIALDNSVAAEPMALPGLRERAHVRRVAATSC